MIRPLDTGETTGANFTGGWVASRPVWAALKISPPPVFEARTIQAVASLYTDYAIPAAMWHYTFMNSNKKRNVRTT